MRILIADDDPTVRSELGELLRADGHAVDEARDGAEAASRIEREPFEVVLLDLVMPKASGMEVLRRTRIVRPEASVIMITGHGSVDVAVEAMKSGASDFIEKPFELEALEHTLRAVAEERDARRHLGGRITDREAVRTVLEDATRRDALISVLGPAYASPAAPGRILRIDDMPRPPDTFTPQQLYQLNQELGEHIARTDRPVVYLSDGGRVDRAHGRRDAVAWVRQLRDRCEARGGTLVLATDPSFAAEVEAAMGRSEAAGLQGMLESLANPIRRAIVDFVFGSGPASYSAILKRNFVDSSSKLSFHLQKLLADGLLGKGEGGAYALTAGGRQAWGVVHALTDGRRRPSLLVVHD